eukprot:Amastigsp_a345621_6.p2 type:complete len:163 gc:universal Amastigsp_a345621_6:1210-722(-)
MYEWNTDRSRTVLSRVSQFYWCFVMWNQTLVRVGTWVGDRIQCTCVLDNTADVVQSEIAQTSIAVTCKQVFAIFPYGLVYVHTRTVIAKHWFRHESCSFAVSVSSVCHHVFQDLCPVSTLYQGGKFSTDFTLTSSRHFVVMHFNRHAQLFQRHDHCRADVVQ